MPRRGLVSIILPSYNEAEGIAAAVAAVLRAVGDPVEVIVVDDDSPDGTWRAAQALGDSRVRVVRRVGERGLASALARGAALARGEAIGWLDCDMAESASLLPEMIERLSACDAAIASRYAPGGGDLRGPARRWASRAVNGLAAAVLGGGIKDYDSGFVVARRPVLESVGINPRGAGEYFIEFVYRCLKRRFRLVEVPYLQIERRTGRSKTAPDLGAFMRTGFAYAARIAALRLKREPS